MTAYDVIFCRGCGLSLERCSPERIASKLCGGCEDDASLYAQIDDLTAKVARANELRDSAREVGEMRLVEVMKLHDAIYSIYLRLGYIQFSCKDIIEARGEAKIIQDLCGAALGREGRDD